MEWVGGLQSTNLRIERPMMMLSYAHTTTFPFRARDRGRLVALRYRARTLSLDVNSTLWRKDEKLLLTKSQSESNERKTMR
jgi:hypothetical protein